jgi:hypothetical protein
MIIDELPDFGRALFPMGFFAKQIDGRIDDPECGLIVGFGWPLAAAPQSMSQA